MTNGEKFKEVFQISQVDEGELYAYVWLPNHDAAEISIEWWNAEYKEPTTRNCFGCKYSKDNHNQGTEECHSCMWENQYTPTTKNDLGVDCVPQESTIKALGEGLRKARKGIADEKVLIGYNMAIAICNKHLGGSEG